MIFGLQVTKTSVWMLFVIFFFFHYHHLINISESSKKDLKAFLKNLCLQFEVKWNQCYRNEKRFLDKNKVWLSGNLILSPTASQEISSLSKPGRPRKNFEDCCDRTKRRKVRNLIDSTSPDEIAVANQANLFKEGKRNSAAIVKELTVNPPNKGTKLKNFQNQNLREPCISTEEALSMIQDANLSVNQYDTIRQTINKVVKNLLPSYDKIKECKKECYAEMSHFSFQDCHGVLSSMQRSILDC